MRSFKSCFVRTHLNRNFYETHLYLLREVLAAVQNHLPIFSMYLGWITEIFFLQNPVLILYTQVEKSHESQMSCLTIAARVGDQWTTFHQSLDALNYDDAEPSLLKVLSQNMRSFRRHKVAVGGVDELSDEALPPNFTASHTVKGLSSEEEEKLGHSSDLEMIGSSPSSSLETDDSSSSPTSVLPSAAPQQEVTISGTEKFGISSSERQKQGVLRGSSCSRRLDFHFADPLDGEAFVSSQVPLPQGKNSFSPCMKKLPGDESSRKSSPGSETATESSGLTPGWPLMHNGISFSRKPILCPVIKQSLSVVNWALQLPGISRFDGSLTFPRGSVEAQCNKLLAELSSKAFKTSMRSPGNVGISTRTSSQGNISTLAQELECLHLDRPCTRFSFTELKAATSNFSPSEKLLLCSQTYTCFLPRLVLILWMTYLMVIMC